MKLSPLSKKHTLDFLARQIGCPLADRGRDISIVSECLRAMLFYCSHENDFYKGPVSTIQLTRAVKDKLQALFDYDHSTNRNNDSRIDVLKLAHTLHRLGDLHKSSGGQWTIPPLHAVRCGDSHALLLGGGPTSSLPNAIGLVVSTVGSLRLVDQRACEGLIELWDIDKWIQFNHQSLNHWANFLEKKASRNLVESVYDSGQVKVYLKGRWVDFDSLPMSTNGLLICRMQSSACFLYFFGELVAGRIERTCSITSQESRRYRFYRDAEDGRPVCVRAKYVTKNLVRMQIIRPLPIEESIIKNLGWQVPAEKGEYNKATYYEFPIEVVPILREVFDRLRIVLALIE
ncbi:hypothetical protein ACP6H9_22070 [Vibrio harveyi]|uniref:hypothetical protein n=1 Tax=Vibrio harveyi TaxID=669 RepID=UPI00215D56AA|nr:hypothetical protein [Vibrio harveyi]MCR9772593.1 hypothetical protein [Vibrio harveyi]